MTTRAGKSHEVRPTRAEVRLSPALEQAVARVKRALGATSRDEAVRRSIPIADRVLSEVAAGGRIVLRRGGREVELFADLTLEVQR